MRRFQRFLSLDDFEHAARRRLPRPLFGYIHGGVEENLSVSGNRAAFARIGFVPRVLRSVRQRSTETTLFGQTWAAPFGVAPMGIAAITSYRGDLTLARAAAAANIPFIMSGASLIRLEEVAQANPDAWFQAYLHYDTDKIRPMLERVARAGYRTLVVTVDTPVAGNRENNIRVGFRTPLRPSLRLALDGVLRPRWLFGVLLRTLALHGMPHFENSSHERGAPLISSRAERDYSQRGQLNWDHIRFIREHWRGRLVIKGILSAEDARLAVEHGADGIIVSNHGGRQLDGAVSPLVVLPGVVAAAGGAAVMIDSGFRRGADVIKALALGADFVFVGRPFAFAAAAGGAGAVARAIELLAAEVDRNMALLGCTTVRQIDRTCLWATDDVPSADAHRSKGLPRLRPRAWRGGAPRLEEEDAGGTAGLDNELGRGKPSLPE